VGGARDLPNALAEERELFDSVLGRLRSYRTGVAPYLDPLAGSVGGAASSSPMPAVPAPASTPAPPIPPPPEAAPPANAAAWVRILRDGRPLAVGSETVDLRKEDLLTLPEETAQLLVQAGVAERVRPGELRPSP